MAEQPRSTRLSAIIISIDFFVHSLLFNLNFGRVATIVNRDEVDDTAAKDGTGASTRGEGEI